jgi:hypothetical protein
MGAVLVMAEFNVSYVTNSFKFIDPPCGRGLYCWFLATLMITDTNLLQLIMCIILFVAGICYFFL